MGEIRVTLIRDDWRGGVVYCVHVLHRNGTRELVVERDRDWSTPRTYHIAAPTP